MKKLVKNLQTLGMGKRKRYGEVKRLWEVQKHVDYDSFMREKLENLQKLNLTK